MELYVKLIVRVVPTVVQLNTKAGCVLINQTSPITLFALHAVELGIFPKIVAVKDQVKVVHLLLIHKPKSMKSI